MKTIIAKIVKSYSGSIVLTQPFFKLNNLDLITPEFQLSTALENFDSTRVNLKYAVCNSIQNVQDIIDKDKFKKLKGVLNVNSSIRSVCDGLDEYMDNSVSLNSENFPLEDFDFGDYLSNKIGKVIIVQIEKQKN